MITIQDARKSLSLRSTEDEPAVAALLEATIADFEARTNRLWSAREDYEETFRPEHLDGALFARLYPLEEATVEERNFDEDFAEIDASKLDVDLSTGRIARTDGSGWKKLVRATMTGGYATAPADVRQGILTQVAFLLRRTSHEKIDMKRQGISSPMGGSTTELLDPEMHPIYAQLCARRRRFA